MTAYLWAGCGIICSGTIRPLLICCIFWIIFNAEAAGGQLLAFFEKEMRENGHRLILTSTLSNERAQFFYRKHGFSDCGSLILPGQPLEIILLKNLV